MTSLKPQEYFLGRRHLGVVLTLKLVLLITLLPRLSENAAAATVGPEDFSFYGTKLGSLCQEMCLMGRRQGVSLGCFTGWELYVPSTLVIGSCPCLS